MSVWTALRPGRDRQFVVAVTALLLFFSFLHSLLVPLYRGPDEAQHLDMTVAVFEDLRWPAPGERYVDLTVRNTKNRSMWDLRKQRREEQDAVPREDRLTWSEIEVRLEGRPTDTGGRNPASQHPFLYYAGLAGPWGLVQSAALGLNYDQVFALTRHLNLLLILPLPILVLATARVLGTRRRTARLATLLVLAIPQLAQVGGLINNDNLLNLIGAVLFLLVAAVIRGDTTRRTSIALGVTFGVGMLTKGLALFWAPWLAAVYLWLFARTRDVGVIVSGAWAAGVSLVVGGWWWLRNLIEFGRVQPRVLESPVDDPGPAEELGTWLHAFGIRMVDGFWGRFGNLDAELPRLLTIALWVLLVVLIAAGVSSSRKATKERELDVPTTLLVVAPFVVSLVVLIGNSLMTYLRTSWAAGMQGRYLFSVLSGVFVVVAIALARWPRLREGHVLAVVIALQVLGLFTMLNSWWGPRDQGVSIFSSISSWLRWSPWPTEVVAAALVLLLAATWRAWRRDRLTSTTEA